MASPAKPKRVAKKKPPAKNVQKKPAPRHRSKTTGALNDNQRRFVNEYVASLNATQSYLKAYPDCSYDSARSSSADLLAKPSIQLAVRIAQEELAERSKITAEKILQQWWDIATSDATELIEFRRHNCRHCHGVGFQYQWIDQAEFLAATKRAEAHNETAKENGYPAMKLPIDVGGFGFNPKAEPNKDCPQCLGDGHGDAFIHDTRTLSPQARRLYNGVKVTKDGVQVLMTDRGKALENIARHLGMFNDKLTLKGDPENPIFAILKQVNGSSLPVVKDDDGDD